MSSTSSLSTLQRLVEQLKLEAAVERIRVSQAAAELQQYCMQNACKDALLVGLPAGKQPISRAQVLCIALKAGKVIRNFSSSTIGDLASFFNGPFLYALLCVAKTIYIPCFEAADS